MKTEKQGGVVIVWSSPVWCPPYGGTPPTPYEQTNKVKTLPPVILRNALGNEVGNVSSGDNYFNSSKRLLVFCKLMVLG